MLYSTGYKKAHCRHLPVALTHSTLDKHFYLAQRANRRDENCDSFLPFALPNDLMFKKSDNSAQLSYHFEYFVE